MRRSWAGTGAQRTAWTQPRLAARGAQEMQWLSTYVDILDELDADWAYWPLNVGPKPGVGADEAYGMLSASWRPKANGDVRLARRPACAHVSAAHSAISHPPQPAGLECHSSRPPANPRCAGAMGIGARRIGEIGHCMFLDCQRSEAGGTKARKHGRSREDRSWLPLSPKSLHA